MNKTLATALVVVALSFTSACGGGGGDERPSKSDIEKALTSDDSVFGTAVPQKTASCIADVLVDSDLSDKTLEAVVKADKDYKGSKDDDKVLTSVQSDLTKCASSK